MKPNAQIPIVLLTGFLGSGKTTLLRELLSHPQMSETAVLINELGAVGLDHHLVWGATESTLVLENGCICCSVRDDFADALQDLFWKRLYRQIPRFTRVIIETTGVADPGPIVRILLSDSLLSERYRLDAVITTVDATLGQNQLDQHWEAVRQVAAADVLLMTKVDLADEFEVQQMEQRLAELNPLATRHHVAHGKLAPDLLFGVAHRVVKDSVKVPLKAVAPRSHLSPAKPSRTALHDSRITNFTVRLNGALERDQLLAALNDVLAQHRTQLLRVKGLVDVIGEERPVVVQAVGETLFPLEELEAWPDGKRASSLVFIAVELGPQAVCEVLDRHLPGRASTVA